jgi:hypothetical protein
MTVSPFYSTSIDFDVEVTRCVVVSFSSPTLNSYAKYLLTAPALSLSFPNFQQQPACQEMMTYAVDFSSSLVSYNTTTQQISVFGTDLSKAGNIVI